MVLGVLSVLSQGRLTLALFVEALPFERNGYLWEIRAGAFPQTRADLISYRELTDMWGRGEVKQPPLFEEMLRAACKGVDSVKSG